MIQRSRIAGQRVHKAIVTLLRKTTARAHPGNSGGPLLNYQGQVMGIATAIVQESQGIGFAIPSDVILENIEEIT